MRGLSLLFALLAIPVAWWAGRAIWGTQQAALVRGRPDGLQPVPGAVRAGGADVLDGGAARDPRDGLLHERLRARRHRRARPWIAGFAVSVAVALYTHNWPIFFTIAAGVAWALLWLLAVQRRRRELLRDGLFGFGGAVAAVPAVGADDALPGRPHRARRGRTRPRFGSLLGVPGVLLGRMPQIVLLICAGAGLIAILRTRAADARAAAPPSRC